MESQAQKRSGVGLHIGYSNVGTFTPITPENEPSGHIEDNNANGLHVGFRYNLKFGPLGFSPELNFMHLKWDTSNDDTEFYVKESRNYIAMPLLLKWYIGPINIYTGPQFSYLMGGKFENPQMQYSILEFYDISFTDVTGNEIEQIQQLRRMDIAGVLGLGLDTKLGLYASIRTSISFTPIYSKDFIDMAEEISNNLDESWYKNTELSRYIYTQIFVGYRF